MRILAAIHPPENTRKILDCLGLPSRAPPLTTGTFQRLRGLPVTSERRLRRFLWIRVLISGSLSLFPPSDGPYFRRPPALSRHLT